MPSGGGDHRHLHCVGREFNSISVYGNYLILQKSDRLMIIVSDLSSHREIETHLDIYSHKVHKGRQVLVITPIVYLLLLSWQYRVNI